MTARRRPHQSTSFQISACGCLVAADLGEDGDRSLQLVHRGLGVTGRVEQVGQVVAQGGLPVAIALGTHSARASGARQPERRLGSPAALGQGEVVQRGACAPRSPTSRRARAALELVAACRGPRPPRRQDAQDVVRLRRRRGSPAASASSRACWASSRAPLGVPASMRVRLRSAVHPRARRRRRRAATAPPRTDLGELPLAASAVPRPARARAPATFLGASAPRRLVAREGSVVVAEERPHVAGRGHGARRRPGGRGRAPRSKWARASAWRTRLRRARRAGVVLRARRVARPVGRWRR